MFYCRYDCAFHVQEYLTNSVDESATLIHASLTSGFKNDSIVIQPLIVVIKQIGEVDLSHTHIHLYNLEMRYHDFNLFFST